MSIKTPQNLSPAGIVSMKIVNLDGEGLFDFGEAQTPNITVGAVAPTTPQEYDIWVEMDKAVASIQLAQDEPATNIADYLLPIDKLEAVVNEQPWNTMLSKITGWVNNEINTKLVTNVSTETELKVNNTLNITTSDKQRLLVTDFLDIHGNISGLKHWTGTEYEMYTAEDLFSIRYFDGTEWQVATTYVLVYNGTYNVNDLSDMQLFADNITQIEAVLSDPHETEVLSKASTGMSEVFQRGFNWDKLYDMMTAMEPATYSERLLPEVASSVYLGLDMYTETVVENTATITGFSEGVDFKIDNDRRNIDMLSLGSLESLVDYTVNFTKKMESSGTFTPTATSTAYSFTTPVGYIKPASEKVYATTNPDVIFVKDTDYIIDYTVPEIVVKTTGSMALNVEYTVEFEDIVENQSTVVNFPETQRTFSKHHIDPTSLQIIKPEEPFTSQLDTKVVLEADLIAADSERVYDPETGEEFLKDTDYVMDYTIDGGITVLTGGSMSDNKEYFIDYEIDVTLNTDYTQELDNEYDYVLSSFDVFLRYITLKKNYQLRKDREYEFKYNYLKFSYPSIKDSVNKNNPMAIGKLLQGGAFADGVGESAFLVADFYTLLEDTTRTTEVSNSTRSSKMLDAISIIVKSFNFEEWFENPVESNILFMSPAFLIGFLQEGQDTSGSRFEQGALIDKGSLVYGYKLPQANGGATVKTLLDLTNYSKLKMNLTVDMDSDSDAWFKIKLKGNDVYSATNTMHVTETIEVDINNKQGITPLEFVTSYYYTESFRVNITLHSIQLIK